MSTLGHSLTEYTYRHIGFECNGSSHIRIGRLLLPFFVTSRRTLDRADDNNQWIIAVTLITVSDLHTTRRVRGRRDPFRGHYQVESLTGAGHLSNDNTGALKPARRGQKPHIHQKGQQ